MGQCVGLCNKVGHKMNQLEILEYAAIGIEVKMQEYRERMQNFEEEDYASAMRWKMYDHLTEVVELIKLEESK